VEISEALEQLRREKDDPSKPAFLIYKMIETAHPTVREVIEHQAAQTLAAGARAVKALKEASKTPAGRKKIEEETNRLLSNVAQRSETEEDDG